MERTRSPQDSRNIIGMTGLESLPRYGKGYYMTPDGESFYQIPMMTDDELDAMTAFWRKQKPLTKKKWSLFRH